MILENLQIYRCSLPLRTPWQTSYGTETDVESLFIKATDSDGTSAWVEVTPLGTPGYLPETAETAMVIVRRFLAPLVLGKRFEDPKDVYDSFCHIRGNSFAKAAVELPFWALTATQRGLPLHQLIGGTDNDVPAGVGFGLLPLDELLPLIGTAQSDGCARVKLKIKPGDDVDRISEIRKAFPDLPLQVDCNGSYTLDDLGIFRQLDRLGLEMIEQPLHYRDLADHAHLQRHLSTPISLDESICEPADAERAIRLGACRIITLKVGRVGGLTPFLQIVEMCRNAGVGCWVGGMLESGLGTLLNIELATLAGMTHPHDLPRSGRYAHETVQSALEYSVPGMFTPAKGAWLGCDVDEDRIKSLAVESLDLTAKDCETTA